MRWHKYAEHKAKLHICANAGLGVETREKEEQLLECQQG